MSELEILKSKLEDDINIDNLIKRLEQELNIEKENLYQIILDTIIIMLDYTNQEKIKFLQSTTLINMIKDYYYLKGYDKLNNKEDEESEDNLNIKVKSISIGDTSTTFVDTQSQININGITYNTGTIEFDKNILIEKYAEELNRYRKIRWK